MAKITRKMIKIDEDKCTGCNLCIPSCPEGALQMVDTPKGKKARLVKEFFCDGLGACIGNCPEDALTIVEEEVEEYDEKKVLVNIVKAGSEKVVEHLEHLLEHGERDYLMQAVHYLKDNNYELDFSKYINYVKSGLEVEHTGCPGSRVMDLSGEVKKSDDSASEVPSGKINSELKNWPIQIKLVSPMAPYLKNAEILIAADCAPFAYGDFHKDFVKGKILMIGCPKLDDIDFYKEKLTKLFEINSPKSVTVLHMEVPCCFGIVSAVEEAISMSGKNIPFCKVTVGLKGDIR